MNIGDTIQCYDTDDLINTMIECARSGIETEFDYSGEKPVLIVTAIGEEGDKHERLHKQTGSVRSNKPNA